MLELRNCIEKIMHVQTRLLIQAGILSVIYMFDDIRMGLCDTGTKSSKIVY